MKNVILSDRLNAVAGLVKSSDCVCDIGTDHGFVPIYLINSGVCKRAIAMDINDGPLERAKEHIKENGLENLIETRLSNGMEKLKEGESDTIVCAGMGGLLMKRILVEGSPAQKGVKKMVLQPQSDLKCFREYLRKESFFITDEVEIFEEGKYYVAILTEIEPCGENTSYDKAKKEIREHIEKGKLSETDMADSDEAATRICDRFGPCLLLKRDEVLRTYLEHEKGILEGILLKLSENEHVKRRHDIISKINDITIALSLYI